MSSRVMRGKPYGASIVSAVIASMAYGCSMVANFSCYFVSIEDQNQGQLLSKGIWYGQESSTSTCGPWSSGTSFDTLWNTAKGFSILTAIFGGFCMLSMMCLCTTSNYRQIRGTMISAGSLCTQCCLFQGLTLLLIPSRACKDAPEVQGSSTTKCELDIGANLSIAAIVLWLVAGCCMGPSPDEMQAMVEEQKEQMERMAGGGGDDVEDTEAQAE